MKYSKNILILCNKSPEFTQILSLLRSYEFEITIAGSHLEALHLLQKRSIDVVLVDKSLEGMSGQDFKELIEKVRPGILVFFLSVSGDAMGVISASKTECILSLSECVEMIKRIMETEKSLTNEINGLKDFFFSFADRLLQIFEVNEKYFFNNNHLVADLSRKVAVKIGLSNLQTEAVYLSALLRDIGKVGIQQQILDQKDKLEKDKLTEIKSHPLNSVNMLKMIPFPWEIYPIILHHHESYNGNGYPDGLTGSQIPIGSRIISVADSYVAMTADRPHRKARSKDDAFKELIQKSGFQFDPEVVEAFLFVMEGAGERVFRKRVLVLSQDDAEAALIKLGMSDCNLYEILSADSVSEALQILDPERGDIMPHAIIIDHESLDSDKGIFSRTIEKDVRMKNIPYFLITDDRPISLAAGFMKILKRPVDISTLLSELEKISEKPLQKQDERSERPDFRGVTGSLEDLSLVDIIQLLNMGQKTARIILIKDKDTGKIYMKNGQIINVQKGAMTGQEAFYELMEWQKGVFRILHNASISESNVAVDTMNLLLEASRVLDERNRSRKSSS